MADADVNKKNNKMLWQAISLIVMLLAPPLLLYPGAKGNVALQGAGYILLLQAMIVPLFLKK